VDAHKADAPKAGVAREDVVQEISAIAVVVASEFD
tara:strand:+ start:464 stop:568 length:105 start_codon:yes stop_codon:yes gene_type:complete